MTPCAARRRRHRPPPPAASAGAGTPAGSPLGSGSGGQGCGWKSRLQAAFARLGLLPPPAAGAAALTRLNGACAGRAADTRELAIVQRIVRQPMQPDVLPYLFLAPLEQRTELVQAVFRVPFDRVPAGAVRGLLAPHAGDPGGEAGNRPAEGLHLANAAALEARLEAAVEAVHALARHQPLERYGIGVDEADAALVAALQLLQQVVGFLVKPPGVDAEHVDLGQV